MATAIPFSAGLYIELPDPDYFKADGVSNSMLKVFRERGSAEYAKTRLMAESDHMDEFVTKRLMPSIESCDVVAPLLVARRKAMGGGRWAVGRGL